MDNVSLVLTDKLSKYPKKEEQLNRKDRRTRKKSIGVNHSLWEQISVFLWKQHDLCRLPPLILFLLLRLLLSSSLSLFHSSFSFSFPFFFFFNSSSSSSLLLPSPSRCWSPPQTYPGGDCFGSDRIHYRVSLTRSWENKR